MFENDRRSFSNWGVAGETPAEWGSVRRNVWSEGRDFSPQNYFALYDFTIASK